MWVSIVSIPIVTTFLFVAWSFLNWVWIRPKKMERILRKQGLSGNSYRNMESTWLQSGARYLVTRFFAGFIATGCLILLEDGGPMLTFEGKEIENSLRVCLRVHSPQFYWKVAKESDLGFADAYINGDISFVDKTEGLVNLFMIFSANIELIACASKLNQRRGWWTPMMFTSIIGTGKYYLKHMLRRNTLTQARRNISDHYDLSNKLFSLFLDETMSYSCAIFETADEDLKKGQQRKIQSLIEKANIGKNHHVLEIGFGWGSLAIETVKQTGCKYTGVTLSVKQLEYAQQKVNEAGLQDQIELLLCDYRQLPNTYKYDRILSCEMLECVGHEYVEAFFGCCDSLLAQNGLLVTQATYISDYKYDEYRLSQGFIREYIFVGSCVLSLNRITSAMAKASRLCVVNLEDIGKHYSQTLRCWRDNFLKNQSEILSIGFDEKFIRTFEYYFDYCDAGFRARSLGTYQIVFTRPGDVAIHGNPDQTVSHSGLVQG